MRAYAHSIGWSGTRRPHAGVWISSFALLGLGAPFLGRLFAHLSPSAFQENGSIESVQLVVLCGAAVLFALAFLRSIGARAAFCAFMTLVTLLAVQREVPACDSFFYEGGICAARSGKMAFSVLATIVCAGLVAAKRPKRRSLFDWRNLAWVWPLGLAALLLTSGEVAEHLLAQSAEETLELGSYLYLAAFAAWLAFQRPTRNHPNAKVTKP